MSRKEPVGFNLKRATNAELMAYVSVLKLTRNCNHSCNDISDLEWELNRRLMAVMKNLEDSERKYDQMEQQLNDYQDKILYLNEIRDRMYSDG